MSSFDDAQQALQQSAEIAQHDLVQKVVSFVRTHNSGRPNGQPADFWTHVGAYMRTMPHGDDRTSAHNILNAFLTARDNNMIIACTNCRDEHGTSYTGYRAASETPLPGSITEIECRPGESLRDALRRNDRVRGVGLSDKTEKWDFTKGPRPLEFDGSNDRIERPKEVIVSATKPNVFDEHTFKFRPVPPVRRIVALTGAIGSGKSTVAAILEQHQFIRLPFAGPLKTMLAYLGLSHDQLYGSKKETPCSELCGRTPRHAMQTLGTEWGRDLIHPDLWTDAWKRQVYSTTSHVVVEDCRFHNEGAIINAMGGEIWHVERITGPMSELLEHASETQRPKANRILYNNDTVDALRCRVVEILQGWGLGTNDTLRKQG